MPLSETTREVLEREDHELAEPEVRWSTWPEAADRLWMLRRRILIWVLVGVVLSIPLAWRLPKYKSTAELMPPENNSGAGLAALALPSLSKSPGLAGLAGMAGDMFGLKSTGALFTKVLQSQNVDDRIIKQFHLRERWGLSYQEAVREKLLSRTNIEEDKKSGVISISFKDRDPQLARDVVSAYINELNNVLKEVSTSSATKEREFLEQRLKEEQAALDDAQQKFSQFASKNMALDIPEQTRVTVEAASRLQGELIANRAQLQALEQTYTPENFRVKSLQAHVNELEKELNRLNNGRAAQAPQDPSNPYPSVKNLPVLGVQWSDLYRETKIHETVYELLTQQLEMARIQEVKDIPVAKQLDPPLIPERKTPSPVLIMATGIIVSLLLACMGILLRDKWEMWNANDPRRMLLSKMYSGTRESITAILPGRGSRNKDRERSY